MTFLCHFLIFASLVCGFSLQPAHARAQDTPYNPLPGVVAAEKPGIVAAIDGPFVLKLDDGRVIRLAGLELPESDWRKRASAFLAEHVKGRLVTPYRLPPGEYGRVDRHGHELAQLVINDGHIWIQQKILEEGLARVRALRRSAYASRALYAFEQTARRNASGIWADPRFGIRTAATVHDHMYGEEIVEDTVMDAKEVRGRVYLNFGADWKTDFTVTISKGDMRRFRAAGLDPLSWAGEMIRVRGWIKSYNGPMIEATHPEQVERIGRPAPTSYNPG